MSQMLRWSALSLSFSLFALCWHISSIGILYTVHQLHNSTVRSSFCEMRFMEQE